MEATQPQGVAPSRPKGITVAGVELIVVGVLTTLANVAFFSLALTGGLEDVLEDAGYELTSGTGLFIALTGVGSILGVLAITSGIGVLRMRRSWRTMGIVTAVLLALSAVINVVTGVGALGAAIILLLVDIHIVVGLARSRDAFYPQAPSTSERGDSGGRGG